MTPTTAATSSIVTAAKPRAANRVRAAASVWRSRSARGQPAHAACSSTAAAGSASAGAGRGTPKPATSRPASGRSSAHSALTALMTAFERAAPIRPCSWYQPRSASTRLSA